jgi:hypothetical protein
MIHILIKIVLVKALLIRSPDSLIIDNDNFQQTEYSKYVATKLKNKEQIISGVEYEENIKYLGRLKLKNKKEYFVLTSFKTFKAAIVEHGQAKIIFLNEDKKIKRQYIVDMQGELPFKVAGNKLFFKYSEYPNKEETIITKIDQDLPDMLCIGDYDCFPSQE